MRNLILLALVAAALFYGQKSCGIPGQHLASGKPAAAGGPVREWQSAPQALMDMQGAMGGGHGGAANAAREAALNQGSR